MDTERPAMTREMTDRELDCEIEARIVDRADAIASCPKCGSVVNEGMFFPGIGCTSQACDWKLSYRDGAKLARPYSSSIAHTWLVVEEMKRRGWNVSMTYYQITKQWCVFFWNPLVQTPGIRCSGPSIERAICGAALAALESERAK